MLPRPRQRTGGYSNCDRTIDAREIPSRNSRPSSPRTDPDPGADRSTAKRFLRENRKLFALDDPDAEMSLVREEKDRLGRTHVRFSQRYAGLEVWPADLTVHQAAAFTMVNCAPTAEESRGRSAPVPDQPFQDSP